MAQVVSSSSLQELVYLLFPLPGMLFQVLLGWVLPHFLQTC